MLVAAVIVSAPFARADSPPPPLRQSPFGPVLAAASASDDLREGNQALILGHGAEALALRVHLLRQATRSVSIQTFIWTNDECGRLLMAEAVAAAQRGVKVRIIADQFVSDKDPQTVAALATASPNLEIRHYRPPQSRLRPSTWQVIVAGLQSFRALNQRMHNKVFLVDDAVLVTGGRNIENTYYDHSTGLNFRDRDVLVLGPAVQAAVESFEEFWSYRHAVRSTELVDVADVIARKDFRPLEKTDDWDFGGLFADLRREANDPEWIQERFINPLQTVRRAVFLSDVPGKSTGVFSHTARITRRLGDEVRTARQQLTLQTPYLVLSDKAQKLIRKLKDENPSLVVRVSTNSFASTDNLAAYSANYRLRGTYVEDLGLEIHEFKPLPVELRTLFPNFDAMRQRASEAQAKQDPFLSVHAKSLVIDDRLAFIGSFNLDPRSENLNTEVGLLIEDEAFAQKLREEIDRDMRADNSWVVGRRQMPLRLDILNSLIDGLLSVSPIDFWPVQNTASFELKPGGREVSPEAPDFYQHYRDVGPFPGSTETLSAKEILTRLYKAVGPPLTPIL